MKMRSWIAALVAAGSILACSSNPLVESTGRAVTPLVIQPASMSPEAAAAMTKTELAAQANSESDKHLNLLVRLYMDDGNMLQFYEPVPGHVLFISVSVGGKSFGDRVAGYRTLSPVQLYQALMPGSAVPDVLLAAQQRADAVRAVLGEENSAGKKAPTSSASAAIVSSPPAHEVRPFSCGSCSNFCDYSCWSCRACGSQSLDTVTYSWCYDRAYNGAYADNGGSTDSGNGSICGVQGDATIYISSDVFSGNYYIPGANYEGDVWSSQGSYCFPAQPCDENIRISVTASGVVHFGGYFSEAPGS